MKPILLPNRPYGDEFELKVARVCARMVLDAYGMFDQWERKKPKEEDFDWKKPDAPDPGIVYGEPLWATYRYRELAKHATPKNPAEYRWVDRPCPIGFIATASKKVYVVFRGTQTGYEWTKVNLKFLQKDCDFDRFSDGKAHAGFLAYYRSVRDTLRERLEDIGIDGKTIIFTGHSLGSAMSTLAVHDAAEEPDTHATFIHINFASPRVFNAKLARHHEALPVTTFRIVNVEDIVTTVPIPDAADLTYQHIGTPISFSAQYGSIGANHDMENYLYALQNPDSPQAS